MNQQSANLRSRIRELATDLANLRCRPCLVAVHPYIDTQSVVRLRDVLAEADGDALDVVLFGPGGCPCCAYALARQLRRRFADVAFFVPLAAKSAATLLALAGTDLVLGEFGELGPLDTQIGGAYGRDDHRSHLERSQALRQLHGFACSNLEEVTDLLRRRGDLAADQVDRVATDIVSRVNAPLFSRVDPEAIAASARALETGTAYAQRILQRYRPEIPGPRAEDILARLVWSYPRHGFVIDLEECRDLGLPARPGTPAETPILDGFAAAFCSMDPCTAILELHAPIALPNAVERESELPERDSTERALSAA